MFKLALCLAIGLLAACGQPPEAPPDDAPDIGPDITVQDK
jgi:predicted small lipoprotein YifL